MTEKDDKNIRLTLIDDKTGKLLSKEMSKAGKKTGCPPDGDIAAFIDGRLQGQEREQLMAHLNSCEECFEVFSGVVKAKETLEKKAKERIRRMTYYAIPSALAAAAVLLIVFKVIIVKPELPVVAKNEELKPGQEKIVTEEQILQKDNMKPAVQEYAPPSSGSIAMMLAKHSDIKSLSSYLEKEEEQITYGFADSKPDEIKIVFRFGVYLTDLEVALRAEDSEKALVIINLITQLPEPVKGNQNIISVYSDMLQKIKEGAALKEFSNRGRKVEELLKSSNTFVYMQFGEWVEGGRLAAIAENKEYFDIDAVQYFIGNLEWKNLPQGVKKALDEIEDISMKKTLSENDYKQALSRFSLIKEMM